MHLLSKELSSTCDTLGTGTVLDAGDTGGNKAKSLPSWSLNSGEAEGKQIHKLLNEMRATDQGTRTGRGSVGEYCNLGLSGQGHWHEDLKEKSG